MDNIFDSVIARAAGITAGHPLAHTLAGRLEIFRLSQTSYDAALMPVPSGGLSHTERAVLAARMAHLNREKVLADHYQELVPEESPLAGFSVPDSPADEDPRWQAILRHTDLVATNPKAVTEEHITALKTAGMADPDIVRLSELIAFISYQIRVVQGLRLMAEAL